MMPGLPEWLVVFAIAVLLFGGKKLPQLGGALGESIRNFKKGIKESDQEKKSVEGSTQEGSTQGSTQEESNP